MRHAWALAVVVCAASASADELKVVVHGLGSTKGAVECVLWSKPDGFPRETEKAAVKVKTRTVERGEATCVFEHVAPGTYAVSMIHDENDNGKMDTGLFGMPLEAYGFSNDPKPFMRAPRFDEASFAVGPEPLALRIAAR